jgi:hypothetical protein
MYNQEIKRKLYLANTQMLRHMQKEDKSATLEQPATLDDYLAVDIKDKNKILDLLISGIWPIAVGTVLKSSRNCATNFCLEAYVNAGVERPDTMLKLRDERITPYEIRSIMLQEKKVNLNLTQLRKLHEQYYGFPLSSRSMRVRLDTLRGHAERYSIPGTSIRYLDYVNKTA